MFENSLILLSCGLSSHCGIFDSGDFVERLYKLIERIHVFENPSLNRTSLLLFNFVHANKKFVMSAFSCDDESIEPQCQLKLIDEGLRIAWKFNSFDEKANGSFMWDEDITTRKNARAFLSLIGDIAGGQKVVIGIIRQVHKLRNLEFLSRIETQIEECEQEGFQLWMIITRLLRDGFSDIMASELCRWLRIPWVYSRTLH